MAKVFISYRRKDDPYAARSINDALAKRFGKKYVYFDLDALLGGLDWRDQIDKMVAECNVMLVVIGDEWLQTDDSGRSRLEKEDDLVRVEVSSALKRNIPVIPVLVGEADNPDEDVLPEEIKPLHYRQYVEVRATSNFNAQIENLIHNIKAVVPEAAPPAKRLLSKRWVSVIAAVAVVVMIGLAWQPFMNWMSKDKGTDTSVKDIAAQTSGELPINEDQIVIQKYALTINPEPADAKIRFLSTGQEYKPGVLLVSGSYHVEVSRPGYITQTQWLEIESHDLNLNFVLEEKQPMFVDGQVFKDCDECPEMVVIPAGRFFMGSSGSSSSTKEKPRHQVTIPKFAMGKYEVTFDQYGGFARSTGRDLPKDGGWERSGRPVINVSWDHAQAFIKWLSEETGRRYRLPSEAEWEYAARAGARIDVPYWWGSDIEHNRANCIGCGSEWDSGLTAPTGSFDSNPFGLNDMNGNVQEWVEDCSHANYEKAPHDGTAWLKTVDGDCAVRMVRGGSWRHKPEGLRSAARVKYSRSQTSPSIGFRIARDLSD